MDGHELAVIVGLAVGLALILVRPAGEAD